MNRALASNRASVRLTPWTGRLNESHAMLGLALLAALLAWLPALVFPAHPIPGHVNDGVISISDDMPVYLSAIRQGAQRHIFWLDQLTTAPVGRILMYPLYTASGLLLRPLHLEPTQIFVLLRLSADISLLATLWLLVCTYVPAYRVAAYALCLFNAGATTLYLLVNPNPIPLLNGSFGIMQMLLLPPPHVAGGVACEVLIVALYSRGKRWRGCAALVGALLLLGLIYPFGLPSMMGLCCAGALVEVLEQRRVTGRPLAVIAATSLVTPIPLYYWWLFHHAPIWSRSAFLTVGAWPPLSLMAWLYAPALLLALPVAWRRANHLLALWPLLAVGSGMLTGAQPQRMLAGVTIPLSLLAIQTLAQRPRLLRPAVLGLGLGAVLLPFLFVAVVRQNAARVFMPEPVAHVGAYLATRTTQRDVILADYDVGNRLVALTPARVIAGHGSQTLDLSSALPIVQGYYTWPGPRRLAVEDYYHVSYIVVRADLHPRLAAQMAVDRRYALVYIAGNFAVFHRTVGVATDQE